MHFPEVSSDRQLGKYLFKKNIHLESDCLLTDTHGEIGRNGNVSALMELA